MVQDLTNVPLPVLNAEARLRDIRAQVQRRLYAAARDLEQAGEDPAVFEAALVNHGLLQVFRTQAERFTEAHAELRAAREAAAPVRDGALPGDHPWPGPGVRPPIFERAEPVREPRACREHVNGLTER